MRGRVRVRDAVRERLADAAAGWLAVAVRVAGSERVGVMLRERLRVPAWDGVGDGAGLQVWVPRRLPEAEREPGVRDSDAGAVVVGLRGREGEGEGEGDAVKRSVAVAEGAREAVRVRRGAADAVGVAEGEREGLGVRAGEREPGEGVREDVGERRAEGEAVPVPLPDGDAEGVVVQVGRTVREGVGVALRVRGADGGEAVGEAEAVGGAVAVGDAYSRVRVTVRSTAEAVREGDGVGVGVRLHRAVAVGVWAADGGEAVAVTPGDRLGVRVGVCGADAERLPLALRVRLPEGAAEAVWESRGGGEAEGERNGVGERVPVGV